MRVWLDYGTFRANSKPSLFMAEQISNDFRVTIDERIMMALDRKRPIGQSRTAYINLLLQRAVVEEPERIVPNG